jgi:hypothetical protein
MWIFFVCGIEQAISVEWTAQTLQTAIQEDDLLLSDNYSVSIEI